MPGMPTGGRAAREAVKGTSLPVESFLEGGGESLVPASIWTSEGEAMLGPLRVSKLVSSAVSVAQKG